MIFNWTGILVVQLFVWLIIIFERKSLKQLTKVDKNSFAALLILSTLFSFFIPNLINLPGPVTLLQYIFSPLARLMES